MTWEEIMRRVLPPVGRLSPDITSKFGSTNRPVGSTNPHKGVDFNYPVGRTGINLTNPVVHSPVTGVVTHAGEGDVGRIAIRDANGFSHEILHTHTQSVKKGDLVGVGTPIGTMGNRGVVQANVEDGPPHIHYQLKDRAGKVINPTEFWNNLDPGKDDPGQPAFLDQSKRAAETLSGLNERSSHNGGSPSDRLGNRFFNPFNEAPVAGFVPLLNASVASDDPAIFADRYGNWAAKPGLDNNNISAPAPQLPDPGKRSEADDTPVLVLSHANLSPALASGDVPPLSQASAPPLLGIVSGKPMRDYPVRPSIFATADDRASPDDNELVRRWMRWVDA